MKKINKRIIALGVLALLFCTFCGLTVFAASSKDDAAAPTAVSVQAEETAQEEASTTGSKAIASEGISRQPEAAGSIRTSLMLGLVFIETVVIYALIIAILVIFVL